jgi:hypothetical protein
MTFSNSMIAIEGNTTLQVNKLQVNQISYNVSSQSSSNITICNAFTGAARSNGASLYYNPASGFGTSEPNGFIQVNPIPVNKNELVVFGQLYQEQSRAQSAELSLAGAVSTEASRAQSAELSLYTRAESAEFSLMNAISTEASRAQSAEHSLAQSNSGAIGIEQSRAESAELSLAGAVSTEASRAKSAEESLSTVAYGALNRIDNLEIGNEYFQLLNVGSNFVSLNDGEDEYVYASLTVDSAGNLTTQGTVTSFSDVRLKTDITTLSNALDIVTHMRPVTYVWNNGHGTTNAAYPEIGLIAQEVEAVLPNVVATSSNAILSDLKSVAYDRLVALLIGAVTELSAKVDSLSK